MSRSAGVLVAVGTGVTLLALAGILEGSLAHDAGWERFVTAVGGMLGGIGLITWGGTR